MANRSDTFSAKLPRYLKRIWTMEKHADGHERGEMKRMWISAHANYVRFKQRRNIQEGADTNEAAE